MESIARMALRMATSKPQRLTSAVRAGMLAPYDRWSHRVGIDRFEQAAIVFQHALDSRRVEEVAAKPAFTDLRFQIAVRGSDDDDALGAFEAVHFDEHLVERLFAFIVAAAETRTALAAAEAKSLIDMKPAQDAVATATAAVIAAPALSQRVSSLRFC